MSPSGVRLRSYQFTVRNLIYVVLIVALGMELARIWQNWRVCHDAALEFARNELRINNAARYWEIHSKLYSEPPRDAEELRQQLREMSTRFDDDTRSEFTLEKLKSVGETERRRVVSEDRIGVKKLARLGEWYGQMKRNYERAAWRFWESISPDPPEPEW